MSLNQHGSLTLDQAISIVRGHHHDDKMAQAEIFFARRLEELLPYDHEALAETYYYLLKAQLSRDVIYETHDIQHLYDKFRADFLLAEEDHLKRYNLLSTVANRKQMEAFYKIMEHYLVGMEDLFHHRRLHDRARQVYEDKMQIRKRKYFFTGHYLKWIGYSLMEITSRYGNSFGRWGLSSIFMVLAFATVHALLDTITPFATRLIGEASHWFDYIYYSITTFTTLGYGDIVPLTWYHKLFAGIEVVSGYFMLGVFINLMNRKL